MPTGDKTRRIESANPTPTSGQDIDTPDISLENQGTTNIHDANVHTQPLPGNELTPATRQLVEDLLYNREERIRTEPSLAAPAPEPPTLINNRMPDNDSLQKEPKLMNRVIGFMVGTTTAIEKSVMGYVSALGGGAIGLGISELALRPQQLTEAWSGLGSGFLNAIELLSTHTNSEMLIVSGITAIIVAIGVNLQYEDRFRGPYTDEKVNQQREHDKWEIRELQQKLDEINRSKIPTQQSEIVDLKSRLIALQLSQRDEFYSDDTYRET